MAIADLTPEQLYGQMFDSTTGAVRTTGSSGGVTGAATVGTVSSVNDNNVETTILAANTSRKGATVFNDSTEILYLIYGTGTVTTTNYSVKIAPGGYLEVPFNFTGIIKGIWAANASGAARVTEFT